MNSVHLLCTDYGDFLVPEDIKEVLAKCKYRKDGQPDRRHKAGKQWAKLFAAFSNDKLREYLAQ